MGPSSISRSHPPEMAAQVTRPLHSQQRAPELQSLRLHSQLPSVVRLASGLPPRIGSYYAVGVQTRQKLSTSLTGCLPCGNRERTCLPAWLQEGSCDCIHPLEINSPHSTCSSGTTNMDSVQLQLDRNCHADLRPSPQTPPRRAGRWTERSRCQLDCHTRLQCHCIMQAGLLH